MKDNAHDMILLFDFFGELLSDRQKEYFDLYYNEDLSLAEIAQLNGITRQGVRDAIVHAKQTLLAMEEKTGLLQRFRIYKKDAERLEKIADTLHDEVVSQELRGIAARLRE